MESFYRFIRDDSGASAIEYTFLAALIALAAVLGMQAVGQSVAGTLNDAASGLN